MKRGVKMSFIVRTLAADGHKRDDLVYVTIPEIERIKGALEAAYEAGDLMEFYVHDAVDAAADFDTYKNILREYLGIELPGAGPKDWNP